MRTPSDMMEQPGNMAGAAVALSALYSLALLEVGIADTGFRTPLVPTKRRYV